MTKIFANPGSTEVPFLAGMPDDIEFLLALHEGSVIGMATGYAIGSGRPAFALLHTTAGLGNAVSALATARVNRAPLVVAVGQQDRRHLALEPFLAGRLNGLAGEYPVWVDQPARAQDVPAALSRAWHEAQTWRGPALVIVPMDDWTAPAEELGIARGADRLLRSRAADPAAVEELAAFVEASDRPALVVGAGADTPATWSALVALAEKLRAPVFQEAFGGRAGFPQDHPNYAGILPASRARLREKLSGFDAIVSVGAPVFRQYPYEPGGFVADSTRIALVTDDPDEAHRSPGELTLLADPAAVVAALVPLVSEGSGDAPGGREVPPPPEPPAGGEPLRAAHLLQGLAERLPANVILVEECPSNRPELERRNPARESLGLLSARRWAGSASRCPGSMGVRMALPDRPVVAVVGDGSSIYQIQSLWSAAQYGIGVLVIVLANGRYAIMDRLAERTGAAGPWPSFEQVDVAAVARGFGCPARSVATYDELQSALDELIPTLASTVLSRCCLRWSSRRTRRSTRRGRGWRVAGGGARAARPVCRARSRQTSSGAR